MNFFIPNTIKGILYIVGGTLLLINTLGIGGETINTIILLSALALIALGIYLTNAHQYVYRLLAKEKKDNQTPPTPPL